ncbi:MAG: type II toxin-antitoxin system PrlF family antitoxin, partial [Duodenibacillus sp.]|nr:type II toxin-antitoxin system PrlF family antitoxin [Duodenibacillus sp.]
TIKGQVTIPKAVRDLLGLTEGASSVEFSILDDGTVTIRKAEGRKRAAARLPAAEAGERCDRVLALLAGSAV